VLVDVEAAWLDLKAEVSRKSHHGQRDLLAVMARLEVKHRIEPEGLPEQALRLYGLEFFSQVVKQLPDSPGDRVRPGDGGNGRAQRGTSQPTEYEESSNARNDAEAAGRSPGATGAARRRSEPVGA
jgi:hypothetical protein